MRPLKGGTQEARYCRVRAVFLFVPEQTRLDDAANQSCDLRLT